MRATIDLPDELRRAVTSFAAHSRRSMSQSVTDLIHRGLAPLLGPLELLAASALWLDDRTGLPLIRSPRPVSAEDVRRWKANDSDVMPNGDRRCAPRDSNALHALIDGAHAHHATARQWFA